MARAGCGDQQAFEQLFERTHRRLHGHVMRLVHDEGLADDVVVEAFARAWRVAQRFDSGRGSVVTWLTTLASRVAIDALRRRGARPADEALDEHAGEAPSSAPGPSEVSSEEESRDRVFRAVQQLPEAQRLAIEASFYGGLSHTEVAEVLGEALGTIKSRIRAGLITLRRSLEPGEVGLS